MLQQALPGSGLRGVSFLHGSSCSAAFQTGDRTSADSTAAMAERCVTRVQAFPVSHCPHSEWAEEGTRRGQRTPADQRDSPCHITSSSALERRAVCPALQLLRDWLGISLLVMSECSCMTRNIFCLLFFLHLLNCLYLKPRVFLLLYFQFFMPIPLRGVGGVSKQLAAA